MTLGLLVLALGVRVGFVLADPGYKPVYDAASFDRHARSLADVHAYPPSRLTLNGGMRSGEGGSTSPAWCRRCWAR